eukprot:Sspe_Gene.51997::Locus_28824_Transcript_1_1_Confidence_1.000_Length_1351::g.51997::m.51997
MAYNRNFFNQVTGAVVFCALLCYGLYNDLLLKPDPAVPLRRAPKRADDTYLYPSDPSFFVTSRIDARSRDLLQQHYERDREALGLVKEVYRWATANTGAKSLRPVFLDAGSYEGTWGLYAATLGAKVVSVDPRGEKKASVVHSARFNRLEQSVDTKHNVISDRHTAENRNIRVAYNLTGDGLSIRTSHDNLTASHGKWFVGALDTAAGRGANEILAGPTFMAYLGIRGTQVDSLQSLVNAEERRNRYSTAIVVDFPVRAEPIDLTLTGEQALVKALHESSKHLRTRAYRLWMVQGCDSSATGTKQRAIGTAWLNEVPADVEDTFFADVVRAATTGKKAKGFLLDRVCRVMWLRDVATEVSHGTPTLTFVLLLLLPAVVVLLWRKRRR